MAAAAALAAIVAGGFQPFYFRILIEDPSAFRMQLTELPYRRLPGFRQLMIEIDRRTPVGARIALAMPNREWEGGYGYGFLRAFFLLPGKQIVPLLALNTDRPAPENLATADYLAVWHGAPQVDGFELVWRGADGALLRRRH